MPPSNATKLISSGIVKPCQTARLYAGALSPSTDLTAVARNGPIVSAGSTPTSRQASTRISIGKRIHGGASRGSCGSPDGAGPKKV